MNTVATHDPAGELFRPGLEGVSAVETRLSRVDGAAGELTVAGYALGELAGRASFEEVLHLLWEDRLPTESERAALRGDLLRDGRLHPATVALLRAAAEEGFGVVELVRAAAGSLVLGAPPADREDPRALARRMVAALPTLVAAAWRLVQGREPVEPDPPAMRELGHAGRLLYLLEGEHAEPRRARALETYLVTVADHGLNASTFTARVVASTHSDPAGSVTAAIAALVGPLHGGAPGPVLDLILEVGRPERVAEVLGAKLASGERLMGFGHRVYRVRDPRADVLRRAAESFYRDGAAREFYDLALAVERKALALLRERKPDRPLETNVEFWTALLLHGIGVPRELFTPLFAVGRVAGWTAHALEQRDGGRLLRPGARYVGAVGRRWPARS